jgi:hypothetical protein
LRAWKKNACSWKNTRTSGKRLRAVTSDIDHLDAAILLFTGSRQHDRYIRRYRAKKGSVRRFVLSALRHAAGPATTKMLTDAWCQARGLRTDDTTWTIIRNRLGACLTMMKGRGVIVGAGMVDGYKGWRLAQSPRLDSPTAA